MRAWNWRGICLIGALFASGVSVASPVDLKPFRATYSVEWKGFTAGTAVLELRTVSPDTWQYSNVNTPRGLFRLALPDSISLSSTFRLQDDRVQPVAFHGSDEKQRPTDLAFDWTAHRVTGKAKGHTVDLALPDGTQDPMSLQIASLRGLARGNLAGDVRLMDGDELKQYALVDEGHATLDTKVGKLDTIVYSSGSRDGERITRTWVAPALGYLPVRAERVRNKKVEFTLVIESAN